MSKHIWTTFLIGSIALAGAGCMDQPDDPDEAALSDDLTATPLNLPSGCVVRADPPTYSDGTIHAKAGISCSSAHNLWVRAGVYINGGSILRTQENICNNSKTCSATATTPNRSGNQVWCTRAEGDQNPPSNPSIARACESGSF
jgi:hypothetical protein